MVVLRDGRAAACQVPVCSSLDFKWAASYIQTYLTICILGGVVGIATHDGLGWTVRG
jgi:hypothetical protein